MGSNGESLAHGRIWSGPLKLLLPVLNLIINPEDLTFLVSMTRNRVATFGTLDMKLKAKEQRRQEREAAAAARTERSRKNQKARTVSSISVLEDESDDDSVADEVNSRTAKIRPRNCKRKKCGAQVVIPPTSSTGRVWCL